MLTIEQRYIISAIRSSIVKSEDNHFELTDEQIHTISNIIVRNGLMLTVFKNLDSALQNQLQNSFLMAKKQAVIQSHEGEVILRLLSNSGFDCIALKGWELRKLYPDTSMRQMADLDILVRPFDFEKIYSLLSGLGYSGDSDPSWKHCSFIKDTVNIEVHKRLTDDSDGIQAWENSIWDRARVIDGKTYKMSPEDFYIFHFIHLHKDFLNGSLGLRRIVDTWLLSKQPVDLDFVKSKLTEFNMLDFHEKMIRLSRVTMGEEELDADSEFMLKYAFTHGIYGNGKSYKVGRIAAMGDNMKSGKTKSLFASIFLPYPRMKAQFPVLVKHPYLLPICWIKRIIQLSKKRKKFKGRLSYNDVSQEDFDEMKQLFRAGGVST